MPIRDLMVFLPGEAPSVEEIIAGQNSTPRLDRLTELLKPKIQGAGIGTWKKIGRGCFDKDYAVVATTVFAVHDFEQAEETVRDITADTEFENAYGIYRWFEYREEADEDAPYKSVEIYYNTADVPAEYGDCLDFRNAAMELIEGALEKADAGEWCGAESGNNCETGEPEVNFGFEVSDFDAAEAVVRATVKGTEFDCIREITRCEFKGGE